MKLEKLAGKLRKRLRAAEYVPRKVAEDHDARSKATRSRRVAQLREEAGFDRKDHYLPGQVNADGTAAYCQCGSRAKHDQRYDRMLSEAGYHG